jgi:predicted ATP-dependent serine protease
MKKLKEPYECRCCGFQVEHWRLQCPACDANKDTINQDYHRSEWIKSGMLWASNLVVKPANWNPIQTLGSLALKTTLAKVKGRPPRYSDGLKWGGVWQ